MTMKENYYRNLEVFERLSNERQANLACLRQYLPHALQNLQLCKGEQSCNILSIGAGDGFMDLEFVTIVEDTHLNEQYQVRDVDIRNTAIEPHQGYKTQYREYLTTRLQEDQFEFRPETFQSYKESEHHPNQYDVIQAIHSIYYVRPWESTLNHCYQKELGDKGLIVCILAGEKCMYNILREPLNRNRPDDKRKKPLQAAERILRVAERNRWDFSRFCCPITIDVTEILKEVTEDGKCLLDFLTGETDFYDKGEKESLDAVLDKLREISTEGGDGRMIVREDNDLIIIYKKPQEN